jgi:hypothetical protein
MKMLIKLSSLVIIKVLFSACASPHMTVVSGNTELKPEPGKSLLVFMRPSSFGGAIQATIYDGTAYIATVSANTKIAYQAKPGKHMFMVIGESADFMQADLLEGKTYYAKVAARMGFWKSRFSFIPQNGQTSDENINEWLENTKLTRPNNLGLEWAKNNNVSIMKKHDKYLPAWENKTEKQILYESSGK